MCVSGDRDVYVVSDREPDHCIYQYVRNLLLLYLWDGILSFLPGSALSGMIGILLILTLIVVYIYHMTKNWMLAAGIEAVGIAAALIVYFVKSSLYENLLTKLLGRLALADVFMNISSSNIVDVSGLLLYVSILIIFVFLTISDNSEKALELGGARYAEN